jgi:hypothetical protein
MQTINVVRRYNIILTRFKNSIYNDNTEWIARWYFDNYLEDNVTFEVRGSVHVTYPNPPHLSVRVIYQDRTMTDWLHLSQDENGVGYIQPLGMGNKFNKNLTSKKKFKKLKTLRKKYKLKY